MSDCTCVFLSKIDEGIKFAKKVVAMGDEKELSSRGYLALGIGFSLLASEGNMIFSRGSRPVSTVLRKSVSLLSE